jgi:LPXTG-site transpeptidase (sortase) family protein
MRRTLSDLLTVGGVFLLLLVGLVWLRSTLAYEQPTDQRYLISAVRPGAPLPSAEAAAVSNPTENEAESPAIGPTPASSTTGAPVIRLVIPRIAIDQTVVPVGVRTGKSGVPEWDTETLFATSNRRDLVGQLVTSVNPGEAGNVVLIGHNYDRGRLLWEGVFLHLGDVRPGNRITLYTSRAESFEYEVVNVVQVPSADLATHEKYLWPTENEQLTLVTCGGPNFGRWSVRVYVIAIPID